MKNLFLLSLIIPLFSFGQTAEEWFNKGVKNYKIRNNVEAVSDLTKAINLNPNYTDAYIYRAYARPGPAYVAKLADYTKAINIGPVDEHMYFDRAGVKSKLGDSYGAISDYTKAIEINPHSWFSYANRALNKEDIRDFSGAISDYTKAIEINPDDWVALQDRGLLKIKLGQKESGCLDLSKVGEMGIANVYELINTHCK